MNSISLPALNELRREQQKPTENTNRKAQRIIDYVATYSNAYMRFEVSDIILYVDSDAAYVVAKEYINSWLQPFNFKYLT